MTVTNHRSGLSRRDWIALAVSGTAGAGLLAHVPSSVSAQQAAAVDQLTAARNAMGGQAITITKLSETMSVLSGPGGNVTVLHTPTAVLVVDTFVQPAWPALQKSLSSITKRPVSQVIDTHWHFDHADNNGRLRASGAALLATANTKKRLSETIEMLGMKFVPQPASALPTEVITAVKTMRVGGEAMHIEPLRPAHTDTDLFVHFGTSNVLAAGDVYFAASYPFFDTVTGGNISGMIAGAARLLQVATPSTRIVPGHGALSTKAELQEYHAMLVTVRDRVQKLKAAGRSLAQVVEAKPTSDLDGKFGKGLMTANDFVSLVYSTV